VKNQRFLAGKTSICYICLKATSPNTGGQDSPHHTTNLPQAWYNLVRELSFKEDQGEVHQKVNKNISGFEKTCDDMR